MNHVGIGFDVHRFAEEECRLMLGGVHVEHDRGLAGHSDADVLTHAIIDALLGATAHGDIGTHFPDTDPQWKDADSLAMLRTVVHHLVEHGGSIVNIDSTIMAESPRVSGFVRDMRLKLAGALGISPHNVSVKATTLETMGALGRGEGIGAMAVASVET